MSDEVAGRSVAPEWSRARGTRFIVLFGVVSLFADLTYEGARSITGPFLAALGASGLIVGAVSGLGEMLGYGLRLVSGRAADRSRRYWPITLGGYLVQLPAVPALALAPGWPFAALLILVERIGKAVRNPARNVMLAEAGEHIGKGWGFGLHEAMDQAGALIGPLIIAGMLALWPNGYRIAFAVLLIPVGAALAMVIWMRLAFPAAGAAARRTKAAGDYRYPAAFWWYVAGAAMIGFGFVDYPLIAYHFTKSETVGGLWVPVFYAAAMGAGGLGSLLFGKPFDRAGLILLVPLTVAVAGFAPLVFFGDFALALIGVLLWGLGLGVHESVMAAGIATMIPPERRGAAYGLFTAIFGAGWFLGSAVEGGLYDLSVPAVVGVAMAAQIAGIVPILRAHRLTVGAPKIA